MVDIARRIDDLEVNMFDSIFISAFVNLLPPQVFIIQSLPGNQSRLSHFVYTPSMSKNCLLLYFHIYQKTRSSIHSCAVVIFLASFLLAAEQLSLALPRIDF